jgi:hypothetical protein
MPVWAFHGLKDDVAPPQRTIEMVNILKRYNPSVKLTLYPKANHNSWDTTYNDPALYTWLLQQRKFAYREVPVKQQVLDIYAGKYAGRYDTIEVQAVKGHLNFKPRPDRLIPLKACADDTFFVRSWEPVDIQFLSSKGEKLCVLNRQARMVYKKIK